MTIPSTDISVREKVGDYTVIVSKRGTIEVLRHGIPWRDCTGDQLVCALVHEVERLRLEVVTLEDHIDHNESI